MVFSFHMVCVIQRHAPRMVIFYECGVKLQKKDTCHNAGYRYWRNPMVDKGKFVLYLKSLSKMFNHTRWVTVLISSDRSKSVRNICVIAHFGGVLCCLSLFFFLV